MPSHGALTLFFRWRKKSVQKKASGTALQRRPAPLRVAGFGLREPFGLSSASVRFAHPPGKSPLMPIFERGSSQCRAQHCWRDNTYIRARSCSPFSLRCLSPLCSSAVGVWQTQTVSVGKSRRGLDGFAAQRNEFAFSSALARSLYKQHRLGCFVEN